MKVYLVVDHYSFTDYTYPVEDKDLVAICATADLAKKKAMDFVDSLTDYYEIRFDNIRKSWLYDNGEVYIQEREVLEQ